MTKGPAMHDVPLSSLTLSLNRPYWLLHAGNCEHMIVIDEIRYVSPHSWRSLPDHVIQPQTCLRPDGWISTDDLHPTDNDRYVSWMLQSPCCVVSQWRHPPRRESVLALCTLLATYGSTSRRSTRRCCNRSFTEVRDWLVMDVGELEFLFGGASRDGPRAVFHTPGMLDFLCPPGLRTTCVLIYSSFAQ
jgi:hypothetical protein